MKIFFLIVLSSITNVTLCQSYVNANETLVFSFKTYASKSLTIAHAVTDDYLVYRYGSDTDIELEYPKNKTNSWQKFHYSYYYRGGGFENASIRIRFLYFEIGHYRYFIYDNFESLEDDKSNSTCGITVTNLLTNAKYEIIGNPLTQNGGLDEELFQSKEMPYGEYF